VSLCAGGISVRPGRTTVGQVEPPVRVVEARLVNDPIHAFLGAFEHLGNDGIGQLWLSRESSPSAGCIRPQIDSHHCGDLIICFNWFFAIGR
jgi:hypothetical protein